MKVILTYGTRRGEYDIPEADAKKLIKKGRAIAVKAPAKKKEKKEDK